MAVTPEVIPENTIKVLDHGFVRLDDAMADDLSVVNGARVSFARRKEEMDESDEGLIRFLMRLRHGTPFEHNSFRFHIRAPIFVAREWFRHRVGCLTGDTVVTFVDSTGSTSPAYRKTVDELWRMWTQGERNGHALTSAQAEEVDRLAAEGMSIRRIARTLGVGRRGVRSHLAGTNSRRDARWRVRRMRLRVLNEETGEFETGHIQDIIDKGIQPVYRLTLADGKQLAVTENHRLLTSEGWKTMREAVGLRGNGAEAEMTRECFLMTNGAPVHQDYEWMRTRRTQGKSVQEIADEAGCSYHTVRKWLAHHDLRFTREERYRGRVPWNKGLSGYKTRLGVSEAHKAAIRRARSGQRSNFWRGGISSERASIGRCHPRIHRTRSTELAFARRFAPRLGFAKKLELRRRRGWKLTAHPVAVVGVSYAGSRQTYDLSVAGAWRNFVANGVVVHNSFNEFSMRYARATEDFYVPEAEDVRTQVGKPGAYSFEPVSPELAETTREELKTVYETAYSAYERLVEQGVARELARAVLPVGAYTEFYWTVNARSLMNFLSLRAAEAAQREIRRYAEACERFLAEKMPVTYAAFIENGRVAP